MIKLMFKEYINEMATVYRNEKYGICVAVNPDSGRIGDSYFKYYNASSYGKATHVIRILFNRPDYVVHKDDKQLWEINFYDKKILIKALKSPSQYYPEITTWEGAKFDWNREYLEVPLMLNKYLKGEYDEMYKDNPGYVSSKLKMPNYKEINF